MYKTISLEIVSSDAADTVIYEYRTKLVIQCRTSKNIWSKKDLLLRFVAAAEERSPAQLGVLIMGEEGCLTY